MDAYMVFTEDNEIIKYDASGKELNKTSYEVVDFDDSDPSAWCVGHLKTGENSVLWPFEINAGGKYVTDFEICYLTVDKMCLVYPDGGAFSSNGGWGEASYWHFKSNSDVAGLIAGLDSGKAWTWNTDCPNGGVVWGNMGYCGGDGAKVYTGEGKWWGVTSEEDFLGQLGHSDTGDPTGEESMDAYMVFDPAGVVTKYAGDGSKINEGTFSVDLVSGNTWKVANLNTSAGAILWPFEINSGGNKPTAFEVCYIAGDAMTLVYPDGGDFSTVGNWAEASFWQFKAK